MDKLHHVAIVIDDLKKTLNWYVENFDVEVTYEDDTWAMIQFENTALALVTPGQHPPHFAIECPDAEKYGDLKTHRDGTASVYIKDPSGNMVEMLKLPE